MNDRLKVDRDVENGKYYMNSIRKTYKANGHFPFVRAALADPKHHRVTVGIDGFESVGVDILHQVRLRFYRALLNRSVQ